MTYVDVRYYLAKNFLEWEIFQKNVVEKIKTNNIIYNNFFPENHIVYEIMWKNTVEPGRPQMTIEYGVCALRAG